MPGKLPSRQGEWKGKVTGKRPFAGSGSSVHGRTTSWSRAVHKASPQGKNRRDAVLIATAILPIATAREWAARVIGRPFKCSELEPCLNVPAARQAGLVVG